MNKFNISALVTTLTLALTSCGGGGGGSDSEPEVIAAPIWDYTVNEQDRYTTYIWHLVPADFVVGESDSLPTTQPLSVAIEPTVSMSLDQVNRIEYSAPKEASSTSESLTYSFRNWQFDYDGIFYSSVHRQYSVSVHSSKPDQFEYNSYTQIELDNLSSTEYSRSQVISMYDGVEDYIIRTDLKVSKNAGLNDLVLECSFSKVRDKNDAKGTIDHGSCNYFHGHLYEFSGADLDDMPMPPHAITGSKTSELPTDINDGEYTILLTDFAKKLMGIETL